MIVHVLVTGSRNWRDIGLVRAALARVVELSPPGSAFLLGHGDQGALRDGRPVKGLDRMAGWVARREFGMEVEPYPADWSRCGDGCPPPDSGVEHRRFDQYGRSRCPTAGFRRNERMVRARAWQVCLAFPQGRSVGTRHCMTRAEAAGAHVVNVADEGVAAIVVPGLAVSG
ncbi:MAG: SLOG family protein [Pseudonocardiaceae bacterium]